MTFELIVKGITTGAVILALVGFFIQMYLDNRDPEKKTHTYKYKSRLPKYYCPHCQQFRKRRQIHIEDCLYSWSSTCRYCGHDVEYTESLFREWLKDLYAKQDKKKDDTKRQKHIKSTATTYSKLGGNNSSAAKVQRCVEPTNWINREDVFSTLVQYTSTTDTSDEELMET